MMEWYSNLSLLVGAGISANPPCNLPTVGKFYNEFINYFIDDKNIRKIINQLFGRSKSQNKGNYIRFENLMDMLCKNVDEDLQILNFLNIPSSYNSNHLIIAKLINFGATVFTTNFDIMIEKAANENGIYITSIITEEDFMNYYDNPDSVVNPLFKLHGCITNKPSLKATLSSITIDGIGLPFHSEKVLKGIISEKDLFVLGYSGSDDHDVSVSLRNIKTEKKIIWCSHGHDIWPPENIDFHSHINFEGDLFNYPMDNVKALLSDLIITESWGINKVELLKADTGKYLEEIIYKEELTSEISCIKKYVSENKFDELDFKRFFESWLKSCGIPKHEILAQLGHIANSINAWDLAAKLFNGFIFYECKSVNPDPYLIALHFANIAMVRNADIKSETDLESIDTAKKIAGFISHDLKKLHVFIQIGLTEYSTNIQQKNYQNASEKVSSLFSFLIIAHKHKWRDDQSILQTYICGMELLVKLEQYQMFWILFKDFNKIFDVKILPVNRQFTVLLLYAEYLKGINNYIEAFLVCDHLIQYGANHANYQEYLRSTIVMLELFEYAFDKKKRIKYTNRSLFNEISNCSIDIDENNFENHHSYIKEVLRQKDIVKKTLKRLCAGWNFKPFDKDNKSVNDELRQAIDQFLKRSLKLVTYINKGGNP